MQVAEGAPVAVDVQVGETVPEGETVWVGVVTVGEGVGVGVGEEVGVGVDGGIGGVLAASLWIDDGDDCPTAATARTGPAFWE